MHIIEGAELMSTGDPDGRGISFTEEDLYRIADSFRALDLDGRVPLKFGHNDDQPLTDGQPALGWVTKVWVEGKKLMGTFSDVPTLVYNAIKGGLYKFVSVELLKDVRAGNRSLPWVLDAVALLGADQPAFGSLADLQSLTLRRDYTGTRFSFSRNKLMEVSNMSTEIEILKQQNADLIRELINALFNGAINEGRIAAAERERFSKRYGNNATVQEAHLWINTSQQPPRGPANRASLLSGKQSNPVPADATVDQAIEFHCWNFVSEKGLDPKNPEHVKQGVLYGLKQIGPKAAREYHLGRQNMSRYADFRPD